MIKQTLDEWRSEAAQRFGEKGRDWKFQCPKCGHVQSGQDFIDNGMTAEEASSRAYFSCIGRWVDGVGCNWTAGGLFGTMGYGRIVVTPQGEEVEVFDFAEVEAGLVEADAK